MYFTDRGIEELEQRRGDEEVTLAWLAERLREFVDLNPEFEIPVERLATWLARLDDEDEDDAVSEPAASAAPSTAVRPGRRARGPRDVGCRVVGDSYVTGYGDPKALGWVGRVVTRTPQDQIDLTVHNLGIRGDTSAGVLARWREETGRRWHDGADNRLVVAVGANDVGQGISLARTGSTSPTSSTTRPPPGCGRSWSARRRGSTPRSTTASAPSSPPSATSATGGRDVRRLLHAAALARAVVRRPGGRRRGTTPGRPGTGCSPGWCCTRAGSPGSAWTRPDFDRVVPLRALTVEPVAAACRSSRAGGCDVWTGVGLRRTVGGQGWSDGGRGHDDRPAGPAGAPARRPGWGDALDDHGVVGAGRAAAGRVRALAVPLRPGREVPRVRGRGHPQGRRVHGPEPARVHRVPVLRALRGDHGSRGPALVRRGVARAALSSTPERWHGSRPAGG